MNIFFKSIYRFLTIDKKYSDPNILDIKCFLDIWACGMSASL